MNVEVNLSKKIIEKVIEVIAENEKIPQEKISLDTSFEELGIDSLRGLTIIAELEDEFNITIPDETAFMVNSVRQVVEQLEQILSS
ncbi:MAG: acyl carrier protein [Moorea sp. SIO4E2]|uniref:acyl carrier protein n=1 Tax=Moorena sp. SIO4E2 TaxID=2607826 RepID=UPI0013BAEAD5|nr:acyl carrier protein [Moorena sp. SIO4E2]NEQ08999.1 acyl carrier protein [Moorena sp. SIO4E2]